MGVHQKTPSKIEIWTSAFEMEEVKVIPEIVDGKWGQVEGLLDLSDSSHVASDHAFRHKHPPTREKSSDHNGSLTWEGEAGRMQAPFLQKPCEE